MSVRGKKKTKKATWREFGIILEKDSALCKSFFDQLYDGWSVAVTVILGPSLSRNYEAERDAAEEQQEGKQSPLKVGRWLETDVVEAPLQTPNVEKIFNVIEDHVIEKTPTKSLRKRY